VCVRRALLCCARSGFVPGPNQPAINVHAAGGRSLVRVICLMMHTDAFVIATQNATFGQTSKKSTAPVNGHRFPPAPYLRLHCSCMVLDDDECSDHTWGRTSSADTRAG